MKKKEKKSNKSEILEDYFWINKIFSKKYGEAVRGIVEEKIMKTI